MINSIRVAQAYSLRIGILIDLADLAHLAFCRLWKTTLNHSSFKTFLMPKAHFAPLHPVFAVDFVDQHTDYGFTWSTSDDLYLLDSRGKVVPPFWRRRSLQHDHNLSNRMRKSRPRAPSWVSHYGHIQPRKAMTVSQERGDIERCTVAVDQHKASEVDLYKPTI